MHTAQLQHLDRVNNQKKRPEVENSDQDENAVAEDGQEDDDEGGDEDNNGNDDGDGEQGEEPALVEVRERPDEGPEPGDINSRFVELVAEIKNTELIKTRGIIGAVAFGSALIHLLVFFERHRKQFKQYWTEFSKMHLDWDDSKWKNNRKYMKPAVAWFYDRDTLTLEDFKISKWKFPDNLLRQAQPVLDLLKTSKKPKTFSSEMFRDICAFCVEAGEDSDIVGALQKVRECGIFFCSL